MSTYTQIIYHIVFSTKERQGTLDIEKHEPLFRFIRGYHYLSPSDFLTL